MSSAKDLRLGLIFTKRAYFQKLKNVAFQIKSLTCILILQLTPHFLTISICIFQKRQKLLIHGICEPNPNPNQSASLMLRGQETTQLDCLEVMCVTLGLKNKLPTLSMMLPIYC